MDKDRKYLLTLIILLLVSIFSLLIYNRRCKDNSERYKNYSSKKVLTIQVYESTVIPEDTIVLSEPFTNTDMNDWNRLVQTIKGNYDKYDGFIIKGCVMDGITYLASGLSFMLENLGKMVVISNDCEKVRKIMDKYIVPEVCLHYKDKLLRGCCVTRLSNDISCNHPPIYHKKLLDKNILKPLVEKFKPMIIDWRKKVIVVKLYPGIEGDHLKRLMIGENVLAIVLENYGNGQVLLSQNFMKTLKEITNNGVVIVQTSMDKVDIQDNSLEPVGVVCAGKQTSETIFAKLSLIYSNVDNPKPELVKKLVHVSMRGEVI